MSTRGRREPAGQATRLVNAVEIEPSLGGLRLFAPLATTRSKAAVGENLATLKNILEGGGRRGDF